MNTKTTVIEKAQLEVQFAYCDKIAAIWRFENRTPTAYVETYGCQPKAVMPSSTRQKALTLWL